MNKKIGELLGPLDNTIVNVVFEQNFISDKYALFTDIEGIKNEYIRFYNHFISKQNPAGGLKAAAASKYDGYGLKKVKVDESGEGTSNNSNLEDDSNVQSDHYTHSNNLPAAAAQASLPFHPITKQEATSMNIFPNYQFMVNPAQAPPPPSAVVQPSHVSQQQIVQSPINLAAALSQLKSTGQQQVSSQEQLVIPQQTAFQLHQLPVAAATAAAAAVITQPIQSLVQSMPHTNTRTSGTGGAPFFDHSPNITAAPTPTSQLIQLQKPVIEVPPLPSKPTQSTTTLTGVGGGQQSVATVAQQQQQQLSSQQQQQLLQYQQQQQLQQQLLAQLLMQQQQQQQPQPLPQQASQQTLQQPPQQCPKEMQSQMQLLALQNQQQQQIQQQKSSLLSLPQSNPSASLLQHLQQSQQPLPQPQQVLAQQQGVILQNALSYIQGQIKQHGPNESLLQQFQQIQIILQQLTVQYQQQQQQQQRYHHQQQVLSSLGLLANSSTQSQNVQPSPNPAAAAATASLLQQLQQQQAQLSQVSPSALQLLGLHQINDKASNNNNIQGATFQPSAAAGTIPTAAATLNMQQQLLQQQSLQQQQLLQHLLQGSQAHQQIDPRLAILAQNPQLLQQYLMQQQQQQQQQQTKAEI